MRIPLFDIDKTLIEGGNKTHADAFDYALHTVYNQPDASKSEIKTDGMIDTQILIEILKLHGVSEADAKAQMPSAIKAMEDYLESHASEGVPVVLKGVTELLKTLKEKGVVSGLLTGNVEKIGWHKMELAGLKEYFSFGSFGSMAFKRVDLVPIAKERAEKLLGHKIPLSDFFIVGDSPLDIACAKGGGIQVVAVAQGAFSMEELQAAGADLVLESLEEKDKFLEFMGITG